MEENDIPSGEWLCHSCIYSKSTDEPQQRTKRSTSTSSNSSNKSFNNKKIKLSAMDILVEAAKSVNPKQFELPRELNEPTQFPGTDKVENPFSKNYQAKRLKFKTHERQPGALIPLPAEKCYLCRKSCRVAPLLACDYCPLFFHLDCLDPPLTAFPSGRWMCPNHVEQFLVSILLAKINLTH